MISRAQKCIAHYALYKPTYTLLYFTLLYFHGVWSVNAAELKPASDVTRRRREEVEMKRLTTVIRDNVSRLKRHVKKRQSNTTVLTIVYDTIEEFKVD